MDLGGRINQHRKSMGISQEELGARLGVSRQAVSKWETGSATPDMENLIALAREFGISVAELTETPQPAEPPASKQRAWLWYTPLALLFAVMIGGLAWIYWDRQAGQVDESPVPIRGEFALIWNNAAGHAEVLELGPQEHLFPFGSTLELTEPEEILDSDFSSETAHRADCGAIEIEYRHIDENLDLGSKSSEWEIIDALSTIVPGYTTSRGIGPGSSEADLLAAYGDDLVFCLKEEQEYTLGAHDYYYAWSSFMDGYRAILFYVQKGAVAGIRMESLYDLGDRYAPDNVFRFPVKGGEPDFSLRQEPEREVLSDTQRVYIAFNQLVTNNNLTAEERYAYRRDVFALLPDMDWEELGKMGTAEYPDDAIFALVDWLARQDRYTESQILYIQLGCTAKGLDGAYSESYESVLSRAFFADPVTYVRNLARDTGESEEWRYAAMAGATLDAVWYPQELSSAQSALEAALSGGTLTEAEAGWCRLMLLYLGAAAEDDFSGLPRSPEGLS